MSHHNSTAAASPTSDYFGSNPKECTVEMTPFDPSVEKFKSWNLSDIAPNIAAFLETQRHCIEEAARENGLNCLWFGEGIDTVELASLIAVNSCMPRALLLFLPPEFEPHLHDLLSKRPEIWNIAQIDLNSSATYATWSTQVQGRLFQFRLNAYMMNDVRKGSEQGPFQAFDCQYVPMVVLAGNTVVAGGFLEDDEHMVDVQACDAMASHRREMIYSEAEIRHAIARSEQVGNHPFRSPLWNQCNEPGDTSMTIEIPLAKKRSK